MKLIVFFSILFSSYSFSAPLKPLALVYRGPGVCKGCPESLITALRKSGFRARGIVPGEITKTNLEKASVFAVPGGDEESDVKNALKSGETEVIQNFVKQGGHYLGVCLGAYLADSWINPGQDGLALTDAHIKNHSPTKEARMEDVLWQGKHRWLYFQDGPEFHLPEKSNATIWAYYSDHQIAALQEPWGAGSVGLIGPHLEADQSWLDDDHLKDPDGDDGDLLTGFLKDLVQ